jgi:hypothetical protein
MKKLLLVVGLVGACGGGSSEVSLEEFEDAFTASFCELQVRCNLIPDQATCLSTTPSSTADLATLIAEAGKAEGTVSYSGEQAGTCLSAIEGAACNLNELIEIVLDDCRTTFTGKVADAGSCFFDGECVSGNCEENVEPACTDDTCCPGTCGAAEVLVAINGDCSEGQDCVEGAFCEDGETASTCKPLLASGASCSDFAACGGGTVCQEFNFETGMGTCGVAPATGQPCDLETGTRCGDFRDYCDTATSICTRRVAVNATCDAAQDNCVPYSNCIEGTCVEQPNVNESCATQSCLGNLECNDANLCVLPAAEDACGQ